MPPSCRRASPATNAANALSCELAKLDALHHLLHLAHKPPSTPTRPHAKYFLSLSVLRALRGEPLSRHGRSIGIFIAQPANASNAGFAKNSSTTAMHSGGPNGITRPPSLPRTS